jgi:maleylacetoacetate isomerase
MTRTYVLYSYYGSTCSQRIRIALALKGIKPEYRFVHLLKDGQHDSDYVKLNPSHSVPTLIVSEDGHEIITITQSLAIMEFLEETVPEGVPLLPPVSDPVARAKVRTLADIIACDVQPVTNLRIVQKIKPASIEQNEWQGHFMNAGFQAYETLVAKCAGRYSFGDTVSMADCALMPAVHRAGRFDLDFSRYPTVSRIMENLEQLEAFSNSSWLKQPDTPEELRK